MRWIRLKQLVEETGVARRTLLYIRTNEPGVLLTRQRGKEIEYRQPDCAIALRTRERSIAKKADAGPVNFQQARARKMIADAKRAEVDLEREEGNLVPLEVHETRLGAICDRLRSVLMTVPSKYLSRIQVTRTELEAQAVGEALRDELLRALQGTAADIEDEDPASNS